MKSWSKLFTWRRGDQQIATTIATKDIVFKIEKKKEKKKEKKLKVKI